MADSRRNNNSGNTARQRRKDQRTQGAQPVQSRTKVNTADTKGRSGQTQRGGSSAAPRSVPFSGTVKPSAVVRQDPIPQATGGVNMVPGGTANNVARAAAQAVQNQQARRENAFRTLDTLGGRLADAEAGSRNAARYSNMYDAAFQRLAGTYAPSRADIAALGGDKDALGMISQAKAGYDLTNRNYRRYLADTETELRQAQAYRDEAEGYYKAGRIGKADYDAYMQDIGAYLDETQSAYDAAKAERQERRDAYHDLAEYARAGHGYSGGVAGDEYRPYALPEEFQRAIDRNRDADSGMIEDALRQYEGMAAYYDSVGDHEKAQSVREERDYLWNNLRPTLGVKKFGPALQTAAGAALSWYGGVRGGAETAGQSSRNMQENSGNMEWRAAQQEADRWLQRWQDGEQGAYAKYLEAKQRADSMAVTTPVDLSLPGQQANLRSQAYWNATKENMNKPAQIVTSAVQSVIQQIPFIALGVATGGAATAAGAGGLTAARLGAAVSTAGMSAMAAGNYMTNATASGMSAQDALQEGLLLGGVEALTEYMAVGDVLKYLLTPTGRSIWMQMLRVGAEEGIEEMAADPLDYGIQLYYHDPNAQISLESVLESGFTGAIAGIGLGGLTAAPRYVASAGWKNNVSESEARAAWEKYGDFVQSRADKQAELLRVFMESGMDQADAEELADYYDSIYGEQYEQARYESQQERMAQPEMLDEQRVQPAAEPENVREPKIDERTEENAQNVPDLTLHSQISEEEIDRSMDTIRAAADELGIEHDSAQDGQKAQKPDSEKSAPAPVQEAAPPADSEGGKQSPFREGATVQYAGNEYTVLEPGSPENGWMYKLEPKNGVGGTFSVNRDIIRRENQHLLDRNGAQDSAGGPVDTVRDETVREIPVPETPAEETQEPYTEESSAAETGSGVFDQMDRLGETLGENGRKALAASYDGDMPPGDYFGGFAKVYNAARNGMSENEAWRSEKPDWMDDATFFHAYFSGVNDRAAEPEETGDTINLETAEPRQRDESTPVLETNPGMTADEVDGNMDTIREIAGELGIEEQAEQEPQREPAPADEEVTQGAAEEPAGDEEWDAGLRRVQNGEILTADEFGSVFDIDMREPLGWLDRKDWGYSGMVSHMVDSMKDSYGDATLARAKTLADRMTGKDLPMPHVKVKFDAVLRKHAGAWADEVWQAEETVDSGEPETDNAADNEKEGSANETENRETAEPAERVRGDAGDVSGERMPENAEPDGAGRNDQSVSGEGGRGSVQSSGGQSDTAGDRRGERTRDAGDTGEVSPGELTEEQPGAIDEKTAQDVLDEIAQERETMAAENPRGENFVIGESLDLPKGEKARIRANLDAIRTAKMLEQENRLATEEEKKILSKYVGWGGLSNIFAEHVAKFGSERGELRELLTDREYEAARHSTENAHYTDISVVRAMYDIIRQMGFRGGRVLEPSCGSGNFVGCMPADLSAMTQWSMVELDDITGLIAKHLYPQARVEITGFQDAKTPENFYDLLISNVPFSEVLPFTDSRYDEKVIPTLHDYFFVRGLDVLRPGGVMAFITSSGTMDKANPTVRNYLSNHADLLGAIRLPNNAFSENAGTEVVTDIIFLRKRARGEQGNGIAWSGKARNDSIGTLAPLNEYFAAHPEMVLGRQVPGKMYTANSVSYAAADTETPLADQIRKAGSNITGRMSYDTGVNTDESKITSRHRKAESRKRKRVARTDEDGKVHIYDVLPDGSEVEVKNRAPERTAEMMDIGRAARELIEAQQDGRKKAEITKLRKKLNELYDAFSTKYGSRKTGPAILNSTYHKSLIKDYEDAAFILALEDYDAETKTAKKARIFFEDTVSRFAEVKSVSSIQDAVVASINKTGALDVDYMAGIYEKTAEQVKKELVSSGAAFEEADGTFTQRSKYLSGNVRAKLRKMEALAENDPKFKVNVEALRQVVPKDLTRDDISLQPGATWIPVRMYEQFVQQFVQAYYYGGAVKVLRNDITNEYTVDAGKAPRLTPLAQQFSTVEAPFLKVLDAALNGKTLRVFEGSKDSRKEDAAATATAQAKVQALKNYFQEYMLYRNDEISRELVGLYNDIFNCDVLPEYDGSKLTVPGLAAGFTLRQHQANAVQRIIEGGGNTLLAHRVGAGKTLEMATAAMKLRQLGLVKKPTFVVPKHLVGQWGKEFLDYFPAAKVLVLREDAFSRENRDLFLSRVMTGDYDAIIMSKEQFTKIPVSLERQMIFVQKQIDELDATLREEAEERAAAGSRKRSDSVKNIEKAKDRLQKRLEELTKKGKADHDATFDFENLGIDSLFVDEAHNYKNLFYSTKLGRISGLGDAEGSGMAFDMYMKTRFLQELNGGKGLVFATATPIMNSVTEIYHMQRFLQEDLLLEKGIRNFDAWCAQFGEIAQELQMKVSGGYEEKSFLSKLRNLPELQTMFRSMADVVLELPNLKIPKMRGGKMLTISAKASREQISFLRELAKRVDSLKSVNPKEDNMLKITSDGRKAAYTRRYFSPESEYEPDGKIVKCAEKIVEEWKASEDIRGTQLVFLDMSTPKADDKKKAKPKKAAEESDDDTPGEEIVKEELDTGSIRIYHDLKEMLIARGIPAEQIAFVQDAKNKEQRNALFKKVRSGEVRVLLGSTATMGTGMNVQERGVALHHLDAPWRPGDIEQRNGRFIRQGNINSEVAIYAYVTEQSFDARLWDMLQRKSSFINKIMSGTNTDRSADSGDTAGEFEMNAADIKSIASGDPRIARQFKLTQDLKKAILLLDSKRRRVSVLRDTISGLERDIRRAGSEADAFEAIRNDVGDISGDNFAILIGDTKYTDRKEAGEAINARAKDIVENDSNFRYRERAQIASLNGGVTVHLDYDRAFSSVKLTVSRGSVTRELSVVGSVSEDERGRRTMIPKYSDNAGQIATNISNSIARLEKAASTAREKENSLKKNLSVASGELEGLDIPGAEKNVESLRDDLNALVEDLKKNKPASMDDEEDDIPEPAYGGPSASKTLTYSPRSLPEQWKGTRNTDNRESVRSLTEIIQWVVDRIGIPINTGKMQIPKAAGEYHPNWDTIRSRTANDLPTVSHEIGHWLDNRYSDSRDRNHDFAEEILSDAARHEIVEKFENKAAYKEEQYPAEGFAEFIRQYLTSREDAMQKFPVAYQEFRDALSDEDLIMLDKLGDMINAYMSGEPDTGSTIRRRGEEVDYTPFDQRIKEKYAMFHQAWVDSNSRIRTLIEQNNTDPAKENAYMLAANAAYAPDRAAAILTSDMRSLGGSVRVAAGLGDVLKMAGIDMKNEREYRDFGEYLVVRHGPERLKEGKQVFADPLADTVEYMNARQKELEQKYPKFIDAADELYKWQTTFLVHYGVASGMVSPASVAKWKERWQYYVPFNRYMGKGSRNAMNRNARKVYANQTSGIHMAKGSGRDIYHPVDNIIDFVTRMTTTAVMNDTCRAVRNEVKKSEHAGLWMEKVPRNLIVSKIKLDGVKGKLEERFPEIVAEHEEAQLEELLEGELDGDVEKPKKGAFDFLGEYLMQFKTGKPGGDIITIMENGRPEFWRVNDSQLLFCLCNAQRDQMEGITAVLAQVTRFMTSNLTGSNILWAIFSNSPRDLVQKYIMGKDKNLPRVLTGILNGYMQPVMAKMGKPSEMYKEYMAMGGGNINAYNADVKQNRQLYNKLFGYRLSFWSFLDPINFIGSMIEGGPRFAEYKYRREHGATPHEAFYAAMDVTVNFRRGGRMARQVNVAVPFFNVGVQGVDRFARFITADDVRKSDKAKVIAGRVFTYTAVSLILAGLEAAVNGLFGGDDDDDDRRKNYHRLSNYMKNSYFCIPQGDGLYTAIPKNRETMVPESFFLTMMELASGNNHAFDEFGKYFRDNCLPPLVSEAVAFDLAGAIGDIGLIGVGAYMVANRDFRGAPIVPSGLQNYEPKDQYNGRTSRMAVAIAKALAGMPFEVPEYMQSPMMIDYAFKNTLGGWWKFFGNLFPVDAANRDLSLGVRSQYTRDNMYSNDIIDRMYDMADRSERHRNSNPGDIDAMIDAKMDDTMKTFYSRYYAIAKGETETEKTRAVRGTVLDIVTEYLKAKEIGSGNRAEEMLFDVIRMNEDLSYLPGALSSTVKDADNVQHQLSAQQYVDYQTNYNRVFWETCENGFTGDAEKDAGIVEIAKALASAEAKRTALSNIGAPYEYGNDVKHILDAEEAGFSAAEYISAYTDFHNGTKDMTATNDAGETETGLKKQRVMDYIDNMSISKEMKRYIYLNCTTYKPEDSRW